MKIHIAWLIPVALLGGLIGHLHGRARELAKISRESFQAGQTLADLSRALEEEKRSKGTYPETIRGLNVPSESAEFSPAILSRTKYFRTENGYVAFVGIPHVAYIEPGSAPQH